MSTQSSRLTALALIGTAILASAVPPPGARVASGQIMLKDKNYPLTNALAYETTIEGEEKIVVVSSGQKVSAAKLKEVQEAEKAGNNASFEPPYLKLEFTKAGEFQYWSAAAGTGAFGPGRRTATAELKLEGGRVSGQATQPTQTSGPLPYGFEVRFDAALLTAADSVPADKKPGPALNVKPSVTGVFKGNGKEAKLSYVSAHWREPFDAKPSMVLVFTEKDHSKDTNPANHASFGQFGSALVISLHETGNIFGCEVMHPALKSKSFSAVGEIRTENFAFENGQVEGNLTTGGSLNVFGEAWEVELKFVAPLGEIPAEFEPTEAKEASKKAADKRVSGSKSTTAATPGEEAASNTAQGPIKAKELAVTKDATDFEYKPLVGHITFTSKSDVKAVCAELAKGLKAQGWTTEGSDMLNPTSSILRRKRGEAILTHLCETRRAR